MKEKETYNHLPTNPDVPFERQMLHILRSYGRLQSENLRLREELRRATAVPAEAVAQNNEALRQDNARLRRAMRSLEDTLKAKRGSFKLMHEQIKNRDNEIARLRLQLRLLTEKG